MRLIVSVFLAFAFSAVGAAYAEPQIHCDGNDDNLATYLGMHSVLFSERDTTRIEEYYAPEVITHNFDSGGSGARTVDTAYLKEMWENSKKNDPRRVMEDELILCVADFVIVRTTMSGFNDGPILGQPPTGKPYSFTATDIYRFEEGRVVERWGNADLISMLRQLGFRMQMMPDGEQ